MGLLDTKQKKPGLLNANPAPISKDVMDFFAPSLGKGPSFGMQGSTSSTPTGPDTVDVAREIGQGIARNYIAVGQGIVNVATGQQVPFVPNGKVQTALFGTDKPISLQSVGEEFPGVPKGSAFAPAVAGFGVVLDLFGAGGAAKLSSALRAAETFEDAAKVMRGAGFAEDIIKDYAPVFAGLKDTKKIEEGLRAAENLHNTTVVKSVPEATGGKIQDVQAATKEWDEIYSPRVQELSTQIDELERVFKEAPVGDKPAIQARLAELYKAGDEIETAFLAKWAPETTGGLLSRGDSVAASVPENLRPLAEQIPKVTEEEFIAKFDQELNSTDEGRRAVAEQTVTQLKEAGYETPADFYKAVSEPNATSIREPQVPGVPDEAEVRPTSSTLPGQTPVGGAPETSSPVLVSSLDSVKQLPSKVSRPFERALGIAEQNTTQPTLLKRVGKKLDGALTKVVEYVQDDKIRVKKLLEGQGLKVEDASNPYQKMTLYPGRVATRIEDAKAKLETIADDMVSVGHDTRRDVSLVRQDVNDYLQATHAPERNALLGDGAAGMTNAEAKAALERIETTPGAAEIKRIAAEARNLNNQSLLLLKDSGVISDEMYQTLTTKYPNHVPLQRILEGEEDIGGALSVRGFDVRSSGIKRATGSDKEVNDIIGNIQHNYDQAVLRSEKNMVDQATLAFVRENGRALEGLMEVRKPKVIGRRIDNFENFDKAEGALIRERTNDPNFLQLFENGHPIWVKINDPALAVALRGIGREKLPSLLNTVGAFTRFYSGLATRFNPEFALPNKIRDLQETMIYMAAQKDIGFKGAARLATRDPGSMKAVSDGIFGVDTPGARLYKEMQEMGGTTGGFGLSTRKDVQLNWEELLSTAQSKPLQAGRNVIRYIDHWNTIFEDSTRLSVYKQALAQGLSKERAASLAKEASINFNRMGRGGPVVNAIWMFANASIQGSAKMIRSLKNPKVLAAVTATVGSSVAAVNTWNDQIDPDWRNKVTKWDRLNGLPVMLPTEDGKGVNYVVIPVSWGMKPIKVMADYAYDTTSGQDVDAATAVSDFFTSVAEAYNPLGGTDLVSSFTPTVLDVPVEIVRNQSWSGSKIHPDFDKNAPRDIQYFDTLGETATGQFFIDKTKKLQEMTGIALSPADMVYAFEQYIGGAGKAVKKGVNTVYGIGTGDPPPADEFPFISRFYRTRSQEEVGQGAGSDTEQLKGMLQNQSRERFYKNQAVEDQYAKIKAMDPEDQDVAWKQLVKDDPETAKKIMQLVKDEKKGLNYTERLVNQLGVEDGQRALYLKEKFDALKTPEDKAELWKDYVDKGIITKQVADQIEWLMKHAPEATQAKATGSFDDMFALVTGAKKAYASTQDRPARKYYIRTNEISQDDLEEAKAILFGEVSNRPSDKQMLEAQTILNTAFNRMDAYRARGINKTLTEVLQMPNQYQAYKGKEYSRYKSGQLRPTDEQKIEAIDAMLAKVKNGTFQNNIGDYVFYSHKPDGRIVAIKKPLFL